MSIFFIAALAVLLILTYYPVFRIFRFLRLFTPSRFLSFFLIAGSSFFFLLTLVYLLLHQRNIPNFLDGMYTARIAGILASISFTFFGVMFILTIFTFCRDMVACISHIAFFCLKHLAAFFQVARETNQQRRNFFFSCSHAAVFLATGTTVGAGFITASQMPKVSHVHISLDNLHEDLKGLTILQLSDVHLGGGPRNSFIEKVVEKCLTLPHDLLVITGDLVDGPAQALHQYLLPLQKIKSPLGKFFVTGNHDYYAGVADWLPLIEELGFTILLNEHRVLQRGEALLSLAGVTDQQGKHFSPQHTCNPLQASRNMPQNSTKILLAHRPTLITTTAQLGFDLQLSGHTHGGQFFPANLLVACAQPFMKGLYQIEKTQLYVNRGTGFWGPPLRLGVPAEITLITLVQSKQKNIV